MWWVCTVIILCFMTLNYSTQGYFLDNQMPGIGRHRRKEDATESRGVHKNLISPSDSQFVTKNSTRVVSQRGGLAILPCTVTMSSPATVSWFRRKDFQVLTVGLSTYSSDDRFLVEHTRHLGNWALRIKSARKDDEGFYECQISTHPPQSIFLELKIVGPGYSHIDVTCKVILVGEVVSFGPVLLLQMVLPTHLIIILPNPRECISCEAVAEIIEAPDLHINEGSTLKLECKLKRATESPLYVFWYHEARMINYDYEDGITVSSGKLTSSVLTVRNATMRHGGNYTCAPANARQSSVYVHVLKGEKPAAMQHPNKSSNARPLIITEGTPPFEVIMCILTVLMLLRHFLVV